MSCIRGRQGLNFSAGLRVSRLFFSNPATQASITRDNPTQISLCWLKNVMLWIRVYCLHLTNHLLISVVHVLCTIFDLAHRTHSLLLLLALSLSNVVYDPCAVLGNYFHRYKLSVGMQKWAAGLNVPLQFQRVIAHSVHIHGTSGYWCD